MHMPRKPRVRLAAAEEPGKGKPPEKPPIDPDFDLRSKVPLRSEGSDKTETGPQNDFGLGEELPSRAHPDAPPLPPRRFSLKNLKGEEGGVFNLSGSRQEDVAPPETLPAPEDEQVGDRLHLEPEPEDQFPKINFKPSPEKKSRVPRVFKSFEPKSPEYDNDSIESLDREIAREQILVNHDRTNKATIHFYGDEEKIKRLMARRDELRRDKAYQDAEVPDAKEDLVESKPVDTAQPHHAREKSPDAEEDEARLHLPKVPKEDNRERFFKSLGLQRNAVLAQEKMKVFRTEHKTLTAEETAAYQLLRKEFQDRQYTYLASIEGISDDQYAELMRLSQTEDIEKRWEQLTPERLVTEALLVSVDEKTKELAAIDAEIAKYEKLVKFDTDMISKTGGVPSRYADANIADLKEAQARKKALARDIMRLNEELAKPVVIAGSSEQQPSPGSTPQEKSSPPTPAPKENQPTSEKVSEKPLVSERAQAEAKNRRMEYLRAILVELDKRILAKTLERDAFPMWNQMGKMRARHEIKALLEERRRINDEMNERVGFGTKFKETALKAFRAVKNKLKLERNKHTTLNLSEAPDKTRATPEEIERAEIDAIESHPQEGSVGKFIKQRLMGLGTAGYKEFYSAETLRQGTKEIAHDVASFARLIKQERGYLSQDDAEDQAREIVGKMKAEGKNTVGDSRFIELSAEITQRRVAENDAKIDDIVLMEIDRLEKKLKEYKTDTGADVLTEENKSKIATEMRNRLVAMRSGHAEADAKDLTKVIRQDLDENWWWRYVWGTLDAVVWGVGIAHVVAPLFAGKAGAGAIAKGGAVVAKESGPMWMEKTLTHLAVIKWHMAGVAHPTQQMIQYATTAMAKENGVKVVAKTGEVLWKATSGGVLKDIAMKSMWIKMGATDKAIAIWKATMMASA